jgi:proline iminopeptidase
MSVYPEIAPSEHGMFEVGDGHRMYWETCGNPKGKPALVLHGGPGSGCTPGWRRYFDPVRYRIVLFDQRGCGRSTPHAGQPGIDLSTNTTHHLIADIERLRRHLGIERWLLLGASWGTTLALAYAERHPEHVSEIVLEGIATTTPAEVEWITRGIGAFFPDAWARFQAGVPEAERGGSMADAYHRLLMNPDPAVRQKAAREWCDWEIAIVALHADDRPNQRYEDPAFRLCFARLVTHYWRHHAWLEDGALLRNAHCLAKIPGVLIHGRLDLCAPLATAWRLAQHWPGSELIVVDQAGHDAGHPGIADYIVAATDRFADR